MPKEPREKYRGKKRDKPNKSNKVYIAGVGWVDKPEPSKYPNTLPAYQDQYSWVQGVPASQQSFPDSQDVNDVAENTETRFQTFGVQRKPVPIVLGKERVGGLISMIRVTGRYLYLRVIWCIGEVSSMTVLNSDGTAFSGLSHDYVGSTSQGVDSWLSAIEGSYSDNLVITRDTNQFGICYSVLRIKEGDFTGWPTFICEIEGLKNIYDPRLSGGAGGYAFTQNCSLLLNWLITDGVFGLGQTSDDTSLDALADANDEILSDGVGFSEPRNQCGIALRKRSDIVKYIETLRGLSRCTLVNRGGTYHYVPDRPRTADGTITSAQLVPGSLIPIPNDIRNAPNVVVVMYTNTSQDQWRDDMVEAIAPEVSSGAERRRELQLNMPQIHSRTMAKRISIERLNKARLTKFNVVFTVLDAGLKIEEGDVWTIDEPELDGTDIGGTAKDIRVLSKTLKGPGEYQIRGDLYDANLYSDEIQDNTEYNWTGGNDHPLFPPAITGVTISDDPLELDDGSWITFLQIDWTDPIYTYLREYIVTIRIGDRIVHESRPKTNSVKLGPVYDGESYNVDISVLSTAFVQGAINSTLHVPDPTLDPPDWGVNGEIDVIEVGGELRLKVITPSPDIDLWGFEWRYLSWLNENIINSNMDFDASKITDWTVASGNCTISSNAAGNMVLTCGNSTVIRVRTTVTRKNDLSPESGSTYPVIYVFRIASVQFAQIGSIIGCGDVDSSGGTNPADDWTCSFHYADIYPNEAVVTGPAEIDLFTKQSDSSFGAEIVIGAAISLSGMIIEVERVAMFFNELDWQRANFIDRTPNYNTKSEEIPEGRYRVYSKCLDSVRSSQNPYGQYSSDILTQDVIVTSDVESFFLGIMDVGEPMTTETNVIKFKRGRSGQSDYWMPDSGSAADTIFTANPLGSNYPDVAASYGLSSTALTLITSDYSFETDITATVTRKATYDKQPTLGGSTLQVKTQASKAATPTTWVDYDSEINQIVGQNFRIKYTTSNGDFCIIEKPMMKLEANAVPRNEQHEGTSVASGAHTITLDKVYSFVKDISVELVDSTSDQLTHKIDNIVMGDPSSFDLYIYNTVTNAQVAKGYRVHFQGI